MTLADPAPPPPPLHADAATPSPWIVRLAAVLAPGATVLDVAGGAGRHAVWLAARGAHVTLVDHDDDALRRARERFAHTGANPAGTLATLQADLEDGSAWPLPGRRFDAVVVTNYLHRPLVDTLLQAVAPGGWLAVETFATGHERLGRPRRAEFLLRERELLDWAARDGALQVVAYEAGRLESPARIVQRMLAWRRPETVGAPTAEVCAPLPPAVGTGAAPAGSQQADR